MNILKLIQNIVILILLIMNSKIYINGIENDDEKPKEIEHGILYNNKWNNHKSYLYYINITDYDLNEENIYELHTTHDWNIILNMNIYTLLTNATIEEILNNKIRPTDSDKYIKDNSYKYDNLSSLNYFFMPFKKTNINQTFFIILIVPDQYGFNEQEVCYSISNRIPIIHLIQKEDKILFSDSLEARDDIHLYYKFELNKNINLINNNLFFFIKDESIQIFSTNLTSLITYDNNMFMIQKNNKQITNIYLGLKSKESKSIDISINLDKNDIYILNGKERKKKKIYIEHINCKNTFYIIEKYDDFFNEEMKMFLIINKLYGNYTLKYYNSFKYENFEFVLEEKGIEIMDEITNIEGKKKIYSLTCATPTAFTFEFFSNEESTNILEEGQQIKSFLSDITSKIIMNINDEMKKYKFFISLLDKDYRNITQNLTGSFHYRNNIRPFILGNEDNKYYEIMYYGNKDNIESPFISLHSDNGTFINYYLTSNRLFYKIEEGETIIDKIEMKNLIFRINKDLLFDYITFEVESKFKNININYEIKHLNKEHIDNYYKIMAPLPEINIREYNSIKLNFSNPYNKFDSIIENNDDDNSDNYNEFFLLISFIELDIDNPIYVNIKYNYNENIISLLQTKTEIIIPDNEYEIYGDKNYLDKSKILFNINKCDSSKNYLLLNYYENNNIIFNENNITNNREIILSNNLFYNSKFKILKLNDSNDNKDDYYFPADYYNKGDIILNYFLINEDLYNNIKITQNFTINYEDKMRSNITLYWNQYISNNNKNIHYSTNYSIYILPKDSIINTMCQLLLIPSNYSIINANELEIDIEEGDYKVTIIASVIDKEFPITNMYDFLFLNVGKRLNIVLIIVLSLLGLIIILIILFLIFRKRRKFLCIKRDDRALSTTIEEKNDEDTSNDSKISNNKKDNNKSEKLLNTIIKMDDKKSEDNDSDEKNNIDNNDEKD